ncbi:right-handed parallel beta-helix repeat-containing protein [Geomonas sp.]|uniref:right-handed parallel beta-helix repeat-containing protein n=1 Tax=Geomonas sp. TaxID=2651584 RepID=UPI002B49B18F|nr:right-handed parallel beta-helix repeat-containing protein [Geomonas sp.]HJV34017.1 right-handed parallel beta-helix repeat-containing protein [Geomonas sp.]
MRGMKSILCALPAAAILAASLCQAAPLKLGKTELAKDTAWSGEIEVSGDVFVPPGVTLTVAPGTRVVFKKIDGTSDQNMFGTDNPYYAQAEIVVRGKLIAKGTAQQPIVFTSAEKKPQPSDWGAINFLGCSGNLIDHCKISYAYNGVHAHAAQVTITNSEFFNNAVGISVKKEDEVAGVEWYGREADITVTGNYIHDNKGGLNFRLSRAVITHNTITGNKFFGIWQKGACRGEISHNEISGNHKGIYLFRSQGTEITQNNIHDNGDYNIAIADEQERDQPAPFNWFGTSDRKKIAEGIFDHNSDPTVARVLVEPFRQEPVPDAGAGKGR